MGLILQFFFPIVMIIGVGIKDHLYASMPTIKIFSTKNTPNSVLKWLTEDIDLIRVLGKRLACDLKSICIRCTTTKLLGLLMPMENNI